MVEADWNDRVLWEVREANPHHHALTRRAGAQFIPKSGVPVHERRWWRDEASLRAT